MKYEEFMHENKFQELLEDWIFYGFPEFYKIILNITSKDTTVCLQLRN